MPVVRRDGEIFDQNTHSEITALVVFMTLGMPMKVMICSFALQIERAQCSFCHVQSRETMDKF